MGLLPWADKKIHPAGKIRFLVDLICRVVQLDVASY